MSAVNERLLQRLVASCVRELELWKPFSYAAHSDESGLIGRAQRGRAVQSLLTLTDRLGFYPETLALAVDILDLFLSLVKAQSKYLRCISVACLYLAAKTLEENEALPSTLHLVRASECGCSVAEVLRMERCILDKLHWSIRSVTSIDFLHIFHALLLAECPALLEGAREGARRLLVRPEGMRGPVPPPLLARLEARLCNSLTCPDLLQFPASTRAVAVVCVELDAHVPHLTAPFIHRLTCTIQVDVRSVLMCKQLLLVHISRNVGGGRTSSCAQRARIAPFGAACMRRRGANKRKLGGGRGGRGATDEENIYEGIKRLYEADLALSVEHSI